MYTPGQHTKWPKHLHCPQPAVSRGRSRSPAMTVQHMMQVSSTGTCTQRHLYDESSFTPQVLSREHVRMSVWERGAGRTLACGTGACAVVVARVLEGRTERSARVDLPGRPLQVHRSCMTCVVCLRTALATGLAPHNPPLLKPRLTLPLTYHEPLLCTRPLCRLSHRLVSRQLGCRGLHTIASPPSQPRFPSSSPAPPPPAGAATKRSSHPHTARRPSDQLCHTRSSRSTMMSLLHGPHIRC